MEASKGLCLNLLLFKKKKIRFMHTHPFLLVILCSLAVKFSTVKFLNSHLN